MSLPCLICRAANQSEIQCLAASNILVLLSQTVLSSNHCFRDPLAACRQQSTSNLTYTNALQPPRRSITSMTFLQPFRSPYPISTCLFSLRNILKQTINGGTLDRLGNVAVHLARHARSISVNCNTSRCPAFLLSELVRHTSDDTSSRVLCQRDSDRFPVERRRLRVV